MLCQSFVAQSAIDAALAYVRIWHYKSIAVGGIGKNQKDPTVL
jgi:hypothetical protein